MREVILAVCAAALISTAGYVAAQTALKTSPPADAPPADSTTGLFGTAPEGSRLRLAAIDTSEEAFRKLDTDHDGRISALEANENPRIAAVFPMADKDRDGYLSKEEFAAISSAVPKPPDVDASTPSGDRASYPSGDRPATPLSE